jgi:Zn-dependent M28 family amino/carboxypeptidase
MKHQAPLDAALRGAPRALRLERTVRRLAEQIGDRHAWKPHSLHSAARMVAEHFAESRLHVEKQWYRARGVEVANIEARLPGLDRSSEVVIVGAHYDTLPRSPGANDNGSGVAALLELARSLAGAAHSREVRFVAFVNEEPPFFQTPLMGSWVYARRCRARGEHVAAMLALDTVGYFSSEPDSQRWPEPYDQRLPSCGDFLSFVANSPSSPLMRRCVRAFRRSSTLPARGSSAPEHVRGVSWSDHWSFWRHQYPAVMVTDTALFRYPHYHTPHDTPDKVDFGSLARVLDGLVGVVGELARPR